MKQLLILSIFVYGALELSAHALSGGATVALLKGKATVKTASATGATELKVNDIVAPGSTVKTEPKSFVKLAFADNSQMNVGPESEMKLESTSANQAGVVNLISGELRAKVTKDLLKDDKGEAKEKLFVKTKTAAMGIRGTDFQAIYNQENQNTSLVTFEGSVAMVKSAPGENIVQSLHSDKAVMVGAGQYSGATNEMKFASVPVKISPAQVEAMKSNAGASVEEKPQQKQAAAGSNIPPGVDPKSFASSDKGILQSMGKAVGQDVVRAAVEKVDQANAAAPKAPPPEGFFNAKTGEYAPRAGGFIDIKTGIYVPPPPGSAFDPNTGVFNPPKALGTFDKASGAYIPPKGIELDAKKGFIAEKAAPAAGAGTTPPASAAADVLNKALSPQNAGTTATFDMSFSPGAMMASNMPPPPPGGVLPGSFIHQPNEPVADPTCPTCRYDNVTLPPPVMTPLQFNITVQ